MPSRLAAAALLCAGAADATLLGAYFANWAQYHKAPYGPYTPDKLAGVLPKLDVLYYAFGKFDGTSFEVQDVEPKDKTFQQQIVSMKPATMKFVLSIGGWNFNSHYFSKMVSTKANRAAFISSAKSYVEERGFDGIDIDWEFPGSPKRTDYVKFSCDKVTPHPDSGGKPADFDNLLLLVKELRAALGAEKWITVASQAAVQQSSQWHLKEMAEYINYYNVMTYDYSVSDLDDASRTAPNCPLHNPPGVSGDAGNWSVSTSVDDYLAAGVPAEQMLVGVALYGHTWYTPGSKSGTKWQKFGVKAEIQGQCCGAFKKTYGAKYGDGTQLCGTLSVQEIQDKSPTSHLDEATNTKIGMTSDGVWVSYDDETTAPAKCDLAKSKGLAGVFTFDTSMDLGAMSGTYTMHNVLRSACPAGAPGPPPAPRWHCDAATHACAAQATGHTTKAKCEAACAAPTPPAPPPAPTPPTPPAPPSPATCPGGSLDACIDLCPAADPAVYKSCVRHCGEVCPHSAARLGAAGKPFVGAYLGLYAKDGLSGLKALAANAATIPLTRIWLAFVSPEMVYEAGSKTLAGAGFGIPTIGADAGYADVAAAVQTLESAGVEVFLSMGGWNYNCFPYFYARYSVGGYGTSTPNYWKIQKYGGGDINKCTRDNQFCYVCEPESEGTDLDLSFTIFPEPVHSASWQAARTYVEASAGSPAPKWHGKIIPGGTTTDTKTKQTVKVPGSGAFHKKGRNPYEDLVALAKDLGCSGVDIDYEEFWHADYFKTGPATGGPWELHQTAYKYAAIVKNVEDTIGKVQPALKLSTAAGAVGAWSGKWWGGNMKGVWLQAYQKYPELINFMTAGKNAGGMNVMTYDLSSNEKYHECPQDGVCDLDKQVAFYMKTYADAGIPANVGYEIGTPAYPDPTHDKSHQLPLTKAMLSSIISQTQAQSAGGFFWEMYKPASGSQASPTDTARAICDKVLPGDARCKGTIPPATGPTPPAPPPALRWHCDAATHACAAQATGHTTKAKCEAACAAPTPPAPPPAPTPPTPPAPPSPATCPGGSLDACIDLCPAADPAVYKSCVRHCGEVCPHSAARLGA